VIGWFSGSESFLAAPLFAATAWYESRFFQNPNHRIIRVLFLDVPGFKMRLREKLWNWYKGEFVPYENDPSSALVFFGDTYNRRWSATALQVLVKFWENHWQWIIGTGIAVCGLAITFRRH
jgi:hypothetical protein